MVKPITEVGEYLKNGRVKVGLMVVLALVAALTLSRIVGGASTFTPKIISSVLSMEGVKMDADRWVGDNPARYWTVLADTKSMEPYFTSKSLPLCVRYVGQKIPNGTVAIFDRGDHFRVIHLVSDQNETHVYMTGVNNHGSDGWYPKTKIEGFVVGQLYLP